jgi:hypothetical protein
MFFYSFFLSLLTNKLIKYLFFIIRFLSFDYNITHSSKQHTQAPCCCCKPLLAGWQQVLFVLSNNNFQQAPQQPHQCLPPPLPCHKHHQPIYEPLLIGGIGGADNDDSHEWEMTNSKDDKDKCRDDKPQEQPQQQTATMNSCANKHWGG